MTGSKAYRLLGSHSKREIFEVSHKGQAPRRLYVTKASLSGDASHFKLNYSTALIAKFAHICDSRQFVPDLAPTAVDVGPRGLHQRQNGECVCAHFTCLLRHLFPLILNVFDLQPSMPAQCRLPATITTVVTNAETTSGNDGIICSMWREERKLFGLR
ncbi:hypothetical protein EVAR_92352_1 [Eumeta japonica]|uniref:Uncharacterized protein n=1 Tax=Eumeta variegata TaxID=151549 RepID=A0A4C1TLM8_EUMVA|nr:hypothetical protein EVAR_92352_1 [Eumeta japonica]